MLYKNIWVQKKTKKEGPNPYKDDTATTTGNKSKIKKNPAKERNKHGLIGWLGRGTTLNVGVYRAVQPVKNRL